MTNHFLVSVAALALIAGTGLANAQGTGAREPSGAQMQNAPSVGGSAAGGAAMENREGKSGSSATGMKAEQKSPAGAEKQRTEENAPGQKSKGMSSQSDTKGGATKAEGREDRGTKENAQNRESRDNNMKAEGRDRDSKMNAETRTGERQTTTGQAGAAAKISTEQRTKITTIIRNEHVAPVNNVDFSLSIGTRVPHEHISLRPLPAEVVSVYPEWRGYEFFLVRDQVVVVDPRTGEIVDIFPA